MNALVETSIPTVLIYFLARSFGAAALHYAAIAFHFTPGASAAGQTQLEYLPQIQGAKAFNIFLAGIIAAFVAYQIERRIVIS